MRIILLAIFLTISAYAKHVFVILYQYNKEPLLVNYMVSPDLKTWELQDYVLRYNKIDPKNYSLVEKRPDGYYKLEEENTLGQYGKNAEHNIELFVIPNEYVAQPASEN